LQSIVRFSHDNSTYIIEDSGIISRVYGQEKFHILVVDKIDHHKIKVAVENGYKLFECAEINDKENCLIKILHALYPECKTCKFT